MSDVSKPPYVRWLRSETESETEPLALDPEQERLLHERLEEIRRCHAQALVSGSSYIVVGGA